MIMFIFVSLFLATGTLGVTVDTLSAADLQPSNRNTRQGPRVNPETITVMRPPPFPAHELGPRSHPRPPVTSHSRHPFYKRPSLFPIVSSSKFPSYQQDTRNIRPLFAQFPQGFSTQSNSQENVRHQIAFNQKIVDSTSRKPLQFSEPSDSTMSESIFNKQVVSLPDRQQFQLPGPIYQQDHKQQLISSNTENPLTIYQNRFVQKVIPSRNNWNHDGKLYAERPPEEDKFGRRPHTASPQSSQFTAASERKQSPVLFPNVTSLHSLEPNVQFTQSIEASEHHSIYHAPDTITDNVPPSSAIRITKPPSFGPATRSVSENKPRTTSAPDTRKKVTLKDILVEDCPEAKEMGYCASPPRYPSQQMSQLMARCADLLSSLYAPVPDDADDEDAGDTTTYSSNSTREMERGNRHPSLDELQVWSWARPGETQQTVCDSERQRIEPGYVLESPSGRWYVVLQANSMTQPITLDKCRNVGKPCTATKCASGNGVRNNAAKASRCVQRYSYSHLVTWDPDKPELCPRIRVFRFPTACVCYLIHS